MFNILIILKVIILKIDNEVNEDKDKATSI